MAAVPHSQYGLVLLRAPGDDSVLLVSSLTEERSTLHGSAWSLSYNEAGWASLTSPK